MLNLRKSGETTDFVNFKQLEPIEDKGDAFSGFARAKGRAGTRNYIAVISSVNCSATVSRYVADHFDQ